MSGPVAKALAARDQAARNLALLLQRQYPPDSDIRWRANGERIYSGKVVRNSYRDRLQVLNEVTCRMRWIYAHQIVEQPVTKHRPDPELDQTLSIVSDALNQEATNEP